MWKISLKNIIVRKKQKIIHTYIYLNTYMKIDRCTHKNHTYYLWWWMWKKTSTNNSTKSNKQKKHPSHSPIRRWWNSPKVPRLHKLSGATLPNARSAVRPWNAAKSARMPWVSKRPLRGWTKGSKNGFFIEGMGSSIYQKNMFFWSCLINIKKSLYYIWK